MNTSSRPDTVTRHNSGSLEEDLIQPGPSSHKLPGEIDRSIEERVNMASYGSINDDGDTMTTETLRRRNVENITIDEPVSSSHQFDKMRTRLQFFFMNPIDKWHTRRLFPFKLSVQVIKIIFVTFQLTLFASYRYANVNYTWDNRIAFSHLFLMDWDQAREVTSYPPPTGPNAVYTKESFYKHLDYAISQYTIVEDLAIGPYFFDSEDGKVAPVRFCTEKYEDGIIFGFNESFVFDSKTDVKCIDIGAAAITSDNFSIQAFLEDNNATVSFSTLLEAKLEFVLKTVRFRLVGPLKSPDCYKFNISLLFDNRDHDGQVLLSLDALPSKLQCSGDVELSDDNRLERIGRSAINYAVIVLCSISLVLCCRAVYRAQLLKRETVSFFKKHFQRDLTIPERLGFLNFWYLMMMLNDILIISGSALKEELENNEMTGEPWNICSVLLGVGNMLVWFGVLRYLGFFRTYNVLILTLQRATPSVLRFSLCALIMYAGFTFCGWLILGPYHIKFSTLSMTSECLFSLINGDDMFATFAGMSSKSTLLWWFSRLYLYTFISLFIYVVLSLFIALIMDAYETIKLYYSHGLPRTFLEDFIDGVEAEQVHQNSPQFTYMQQSSMNEQANESSAAGGLLDTIVETLCRCNNEYNSGSGSHMNSFKSSDSPEDEPLLPNT